MKLYGAEFKEELKVTKAEAKHIYYGGFEVKGIVNKDYILYIITNAFSFDKDDFSQNLALKNIYKFYKWVLTNKLKQGDIVKEVFQEDKNLYVYDKKDKDYNMKWCWYIYKNRPKTALCDDWVYKLVERE